MHVYVWYATDFTELTIFLFLFMMIFKAKHKSHTRLVVEGKTVNSCPGYTQGCLWPLCYGGKKKESRKKYTSV